MLPNTHRLLQFLAVRHKSNCRKHELRSRRNRRRRPVQYDLLLAVCTQILHGPHRRCGPPHVVKSLALVQNKHMRSAQERGFGGTKIGRFSFGFIGVVFDLDLVRIHWKFLRFEFDFDFDSDSAFIFLFFLLNAFVWNTIGIGIRIGIGDFMF